jgi:hypothetical protein
VGEGLPPLWQYSLRLPEADESIPAPKEELTAAAKNSFSGPTSWGRY